MNPLKRFAYNYLIPIIGKNRVGKNLFVNVIYYHDIVKEEGQSFMRTNIEVFKRHMQYIADHGYKTFRFDDLNNEENLKFGEKKVVIAFDDGWVSNYTEIFEFMQSLELKYNIYLTIGEIGNNKDYLTWEQVRLMHKEGLVGFGAHTYSHHDMSDISKIDPAVEFTKADKVFEEQLGFKPLDFCYPFGFYSEESNAYIIRNTNYKRIYTSRMMYSYLQVDKVVFGRNGISNDESFGVFKAKLKGYFNVWKSLIH